MVQVKQENFGQLSDGTPVSKFTLENENGMSCKVMEYGACILGVLVPDRDGVIDDVTLGFETVKDYEERNDAYFGVVVGRVCNRIAKGRFELNGATFQLECNNGPNHLHGGVSGFSKRLWKGSIVDDATVHFHLESVDGDQGYPGELVVDVWYTLSSENELQMCTKAVVRDKPTLVSMTNHTYFNLHGMGSPGTTVLDHQLYINAAEYTPVDDTGIPLGTMASVQELDGVYDFSKGKLISAQIDATPNGYDHNYCLAKGAACAARLYEPQSGRCVEISTDQPGLQLYTGNFVDCTNGKGSTSYSRHSGVCLETQFYPDAINQEQFQSPILLPNEVYEKQTTWKFTTK